MKLIQVSEPGGPEVMRLADGPIPAPSAADVVIKVSAAGVNRPDLMQRAGKYPPPPGASPILGLEAAGVVAQAGPQSGWNEGDAVCALTPGGGYAEYCAAPGAQCLRIPAGLSMVEAAGIPETFFTVWANLFEIGGLRSGERVLVHGGASGIGVTAIQLARAFGATVFATAGTQAKCQACVDLGAERAVNYNEADFGQEFSKIDLILDMVGAAYTARNIDILAPRGRLVHIAAQQGVNATVNLVKVIQKRLTITGSAMRPRPVAEKAAIARELEAKVWPLFESGKVKVLVDRTFPLADAAGAHRYLDSGAHIGKVILTV
jgi:NADPH:quinone reductase